MGQVSAYRPQKFLLGFLTSSAVLGLISKYLFPHVKTIVGVDISQGMVDQYNLRIQREGIPLEKMRAVRAELEGKAGELDDMKFDVIVVSVLNFSLIEMD